MRPALFHPQLLKAVHTSLSLLYKKGRRYIHYPIIGGGGMPFLSYCVNKPHTAQTVNETEAGAIAIEEWDRQCSDLRHPQDIYIVGTQLKKIVMKENYGKHSIQGVGTGQPSKSRRSPWASTSLYTPLDGDNNL